jgi:hypothetical protein
MSDPTTLRPEASPAGGRAPGPEPLLLHFAFGFLFGIVLVKSEAVSWFRIQEMFRFQSFHMYGILGSGVVTASALMAVFRRLGVRTVEGQEMRIESRVWQPWGNALGGLSFGLGWGLLGACPGPIYALLGSGVTVMVVALTSALAGAWTYGHLKPRLPH